MTDSFNDPWTSTSHEKKGNQTISLQPPVKKSKVAMKVAFFTFIIGVFLFLFFIIEKRKSLSNSSGSTHESSETRTVAAIKALGDPSTVLGNFTCEIQNKKESYCPDDIINWKLTAFNATFSDPTQGNTLMNCQIRGPPANSVSTRPSGPRGFIDNCSPRLEGQNLQSFLEAGGAGTFRVPSTNYVGYNQWIDLYFYFENNGAISSNFLTNVFCPEFAVSDCNATSTTSTSTLTTSTSTSISTSSASSFSSIVSETETSTRPTSTNSELSSALSKLEYSLPRLFLLFLFFINV